MATGATGAAELVKTAIDKLQIIDTTPFFEISPTGSYGSSYKTVYNHTSFKSKDPETKSTVRTSGILSNNGKVVYSPTGATGP
jgi:hypothetical protein